MLPLKCFKMQFTSPGPLKEKKQFISYNQLKHGSGLWVWWWLTLSLGLFWNALCPLCWKPRALSALLCLPFWAHTGFWACGHGHGCQPRFQVTKRHRSHCVFSCGDLKVSGLPGPVSLCLKSWFRKATVAASCGETGCRCGKDLVLHGEHLLASAIAAQERGHGDDAVSALGGSQGFVTDPADLKGAWGRWPEVDGGAGSPLAFSSCLAHCAVSSWIHSASLFRSAERPAVGSWAGGLGRRQRIRGVSGHRSSTSAPPWSLCL